MQAAPRVLSRLRIAFGTFVAIDAEAEDPDIAARGIDIAFDAVRTVERLMHPTRAGGDLAALSAAPENCCVAIHPWTWEVLDLCRQLNAASRSIFDPCLPASVGRMRDVELLPGCYVRLNAPVRLDLGGVAKGYAVDRAVEALRRAGCVGGLVNAGGDLAVFGPRPRRIVCREIGRAGRATQLRDAALATSAVGDPSRPSEHRGHYHGVSGEFASAGRVAVIARRAAVADGLSKCLLWCDRASGDELLRRFGAARLGAQNASPSPRSNRLKSEFHSNHW
jgi:thiamine biosynthesis lipoprotein